MCDSDREEAEPVCSLPAFLVEADERQDSNTLYKYRDFGQVQEDDDDVAEIPPPTPSSRGSTESSIRVQKFPVKLYAILAQKEFHDIICWMPHGRSWKVLKPTMFESLVMPLFFEYSNYHSFNRLVNAWSFRRISSGPDRGSYYHELFLRGKPFLQKYMRRLPKTHKKLPMRKKDEPDFYKLDKTSVLPAFEDAPIPGAAATSAAMRQQQQQQHQPHSHPMPHITVSSHHQHSPMTSVVTPPHLSPSVMNGNGISQNSSMNHNGQIGSMGGFMEPNSVLRSNNDGMRRSNNDMVPMGGMSLNGGMLGLNGGGMGQSLDMGSHIGNMSSNGMNQNRMHGGNNVSQITGPLPPRFNGYNPPADSFDPQDEFDLQPSLSGGLGSRNGLSGLGMGQLNNLNNMNCGGIGNSSMGYNNSGGGCYNGLGGGNGYSDTGRGIGGGSGYIDTGNNGSSRFNGLHPGRTDVRRSNQIRQQDHILGGGINEGPTRSGGIGNGQQDFYPSSYSQQQLHHQMSSSNSLGGHPGQISQRPNQLYQHQDSMRSSPPVQSQLMNNMPINMQQQLFGRGMGNGDHDDYNSVGLRPSLSRV